MSLQKQWRSLDRSTVSKAPDRYGVYELGDADGTVLKLDTGVLRDVVKDALSYEPNAKKIRWTVAQSRSHAEQLAAEHQ